MSQVLSDQATAVEAWVRLLRAHSALTRAFSAELQREHGLTINDYEALLLLFRAPDRRMRRIDLANGLVLTASGVTRLLDGLVRAGYVDKAACDSDARVSYAVLSEDGTRKLAQATKSHVAAIRAVFSERFSAQELDMLARLLGRLPGAEARVEDGECGP